MNPWWQTETESSDASAFVVIEAKLHDPSGLKQKLLDRMSVLVSETVRELLARVRNSLEIESTEDGEFRATLLFNVNSEKASRIKNLLAQEKLDDQGNPRMYSNAYRFIACDQVGAEKYLVASRLAVRQWKISAVICLLYPLMRFVVLTAREKGPLSLIPATTSFQQLLMGYFAPDMLSHLPRALCPGVCQEVSQQVTSYLGQLNSPRVKGEVSFPTVESRDPAVCRRQFITAIDALCSDWRPLERSKLRDLYPAEFKDDDPRGDRLVVSDERWLRIIRSAKPSPFTLFFVTGDTVKILQSEQQIGAGVSAMNRYSGLDEHDPKILAARPKEIRERGYTTTKLSWAALPLTDCFDDQIQDYLRQIRNQPAGLPKDFSPWKSSQTKSGKNRRKKQRRETRLSAVPQPPENLRPYPITGQTKIPKQLHEKFILMPLLGNHDRLERVLNRSDLEIAWTRAVKKRDDWYLQLTLRVPIASPVATGRVLAVSFGLDAVVTWCFDNAKYGSISPNLQILAFLKEKRLLEGQQKRQRWIGGRSFGKKLQSIAHQVANDLVELARTHDAALAVEDISYVQKAGLDHAKNLLFSAWNYGQLRNYLKYKAQIAGLGEPLFISDFLVAFTCPQCGARRKPKQKEDAAETWIKDGVLHCRKCGFAAKLTPEQKAFRVCQEALGLLQSRAQE